MATKGKPPSAKTLVDRQLGRNVVHPILPAGESFVIPNHSGDHTAGETDTPTSDRKIANKEYVDNADALKLNLDTSNDPLTDNLKIEKNVNGGDVSLTLRNTAASGSTDETVSLIAQTTTSNNAMGKIEFGRVTSYANPPNRNSFIKFYTNDFGNDILAMTINEAGEIINRFSIENSRAKMTNRGGYAIKLTNKTGSNSVTGQLVQTDTTTNDAVNLSGVNSDDTIGIILDSGVSDGTDMWVVVYGIADVLMNAVGSVRGDRIISAPVGGFATPWNVGGAVATHFQEIGHCIETRVGAGLARCVLHFN